MLMRKRVERQALLGPLAGWIAVVGSVGLTAFLFVRVLELEALGPLPGGPGAPPLGAAPAAALAAVLVLTLSGAALVLATLVSALLRNQRMSPRYAGMLYGRPLVVMLHLFYPAGVLFGLLVVATGGDRPGPVGLAMLGMWTAAGTAALLPYAGWLARDPEPELVAEMVAAIASSVARCFSKSDFSSAAKARVLQRLRDLGAVGQRFMLSGDPQLAVGVLEALHDVVVDYLDRKDLSQRSWFIVETSYFRGLAPKTVEAVTAAGTWFELACLLEIRNLLRTAQASTSDLPGDAATLVGRLCIEALERKDNEALRLMLAFLYDLLSDELLMPRRVGTLAEVLSHLRHVAREGLDVFPTLVETHGRTLTSLVVLAVESGKMPQAQRLLGELVDLIAQAGELDLGLQLVALYWRLGSVIRAESPEGNRLWEKGLVVLGATLRASVPESNALYRAVLAELKKIAVTEVAEAVVLESPPLGWESSGFGLDRSLREGIVKLVRDIKEG
jgi:hypothetical protein